MRYTFVIPWISLVMIFSTGCKKQQAKSFDYEMAAGLWVPYEMTDQDGTLHSGPFSASNIFGFYAESVQLKSDRTFIPVIWINSNDYTLKHDEAGTYSYVHEDKLSFVGFGNFVYDITRFEPEELWLTMHPMTGTVLYKFRKQP